MVWFPERGERPRGRWFGLTGGRGRRHPLVPTIVAAFGAFAAVVAPFRHQYWSVDVPAGGTGEPLPRVAGAVPQFRLQVWYSGRFLIWR